MGNVLHINSYSTRIGSVKHVISVEIKCLAKTDIRSTIEKKTPRAKEEAITDAYIYDVSRPISFLTEVLMHLVAETRGMPDTYQISRHPDIISAVGNNRTRDKERWSLSKYVGRVPNVGHKNV